MKINLLEQFRRLNIELRLDMHDLVDAARDGSIGKLVWNERRGGGLVALCGEWPGWPRCECACCECDEPASTTDDGGVPVCEECAEYTLDDDESVVCSRSGRTETVQESCGAGNQVRSYVRIKPPEPPEESEEGEYCLYWETVGDDAHVVARYDDYETALQALRSKDWPRPGDTTNYLCGYSVRRLEDGEWVGTDVEVA